MLTLRRGRVTAVVERVEGLSRLEVDGVPCVAYPRVTGPVTLGDDVLVNTQARELELGTGGFDVLYANLTRGLDLPPDSDAHVMKLPYTPAQGARRHAEEGRTLPDTLAGLPVVCCSLHSQVVPVCAGIGHDARVAYVQLGGGALPVSLSNALRALRERDQGVSHHTWAVLELCLGDVIVPWPAGYDAPPWLESRLEVDVSGWEEACAGLPLAHMERGPKEESLFFATAFAAGRLAAGRVERLAS